MHIFRDLCASLLIFVVGFVLSSCTDHSLKANDVYLSVGSDCFSYANTQQDCMGIKMQAIKGNLYLYIPESDYCEEPSIFVFSKGGVIKQDNIMITSWHKSLWNDRLAGFGKGYLYIERYPAKSTERNYPKRCELVCYNLVTGELETLLCTEDASYMDVAFDENGAVVNVMFDAAASETKGLGTKVEAPEYIANFIGMTSADQPTTVDVIANCTYSSKGAMEVVAKAITVYNAIK